MLTEKKIAMILHTNGLEYDDRIRKEMETVMKLFPEIKFKIFAIIDGKHDKCESGITSYNIEYEIPFLLSRKKYRPGTHLLQKAWDFYKTVKPKLDDFDAIWCADFDIFFFILCTKKPKVWDMHELPMLFLGNPIKKTFLRFLIKKCQVVIHANIERLNYLKEKKVISDISKHCIVRNYPSIENELLEIEDIIYSKFLNWKGESSCAYIQGIGGYARCPEECIDAIMQIKNLKAVVIGSFDNQLKSKLLQKYPFLEERIFFVGMVPQRFTIMYINKCDVSLVFYRNISPNNYYCEPNRMFQSIMADCPVVVGNNPPMKNLVDRYQFGISLSDDGSNVDNICTAIQIVLTNRDTYVQNIRNNKYVIEWKNQVDEFRTIITNLFKK